MIKPPRVIGRQYLSPYFYFLPVAYVHVRRVSVWSIHVLTSHSSLTLNLVAATFWWTRSTLTSLEKSIRATLCDLPWGGLKTSHNQLQWSPCTTSTWCLMVPHCSKPSKWRQPSREIRNPQLECSLVLVDWNSLSKCTRSLPISL